MKQLTKAGILAAGLAVVSQMAQAQFTANDLYLGFTSSSASSDYIVDLGQAGSLGLSTSTAVNLDTYISGFDGIFSTPVGVGVGVVGGQNTFPATLDDMYYTAPVGADMSSITFASIAIGAVNRLDAPAAGSGVADSTKTWAANIPVNNANDFYGASGVNPDLSIDSSDLNPGTQSYDMTESVWEATSSGSTFLGNITMTVPEPSTISILGGCGALFGLLRWRKGSKNANV